MTDPCKFTALFAGKTGSVGSIGLAGFARLSCVGMLSAAAMAFATAAPSGTDEPSPVVAEATMVIGIARIAGSDGVMRTVDRGSAVRVGDKIETQAGGHVHLRFVDGGRVSLRPSSRLAIEEYSRSVAGGAGAIKFRLEEGVVRSITGEWGEASRERFRLNTPLAAIGIKGTDFVARADEDKTAASVFSGSIVLTPLDAACAFSVGPCLNGREALLTQDMRGQVLQIEREQARPAYVAGTGGASRAGSSVAMAVTRVTPPDADSVVTPEADGFGQMKASEARASETPVVSTSTPPRVEQLAWGRWAWAKAIEGDEIGQTIDAAFRAGRQGLVSNGAYSLYRPAAASDARLIVQDTAVTFRLAGSAAHVVYEGGVTEAASVTGGRLGVDFARSTFSTQLDVKNDTIGSQSIAADGTVLPSGLFLSLSGNAYIAGALSLDGREAGYFFEKPIAAGQLRGITLWGP